MTTWLLISIIIGSVLLLLGLLCVLGANKRYEKLKKKYEEIPVESGVSSTDLLYYVEDSGELDTTNMTLINTADDNSYSPKYQTVCLSCDIIDSKSIYALACTAHELGHAKEHQRGSRVVGLWYNLTIFENLTSHIILPFFIIGFILSLISGWTTYLGTLLLNLSTLFTICAILGRLITLPTEQHASAYALYLLKSSGAMNSGELKKAENFLNTALSTYIYGFFDRLFYNFKLVGKGINKINNKLKKGRGQND